MKRLYSKLKSEGLELRNSSCNKKVFYKDNYIGILVADKEEPVGILKYMNVEEWENEQILNDKYEGKRKLTEILREFNWKTCVLK